METFYGSNHGKEREFACGWDFWVIPEEYAPLERNIVLQSRIPSDSVGVNTSQEFLIFFERGAKTLSLKFFQK